MMCPLRAAWQKFRRSDAGTATVEFVIVFPAILIIFLSAFEAGFLMIRQVMLERAVDIAVRDLRLGTWSPPTHEELKQAICDRSVIINDCMGVMLLELRPVDKVSWQPLEGQVTCVDRGEEIQPVTTFNGGTGNEMMLVRACAVFDPIFPGTGLGFRLPKDETGGYALVSTSAFVNEPL